MYCAIFAIKTSDYFIKGKVEEGEVEIQYCPTDKMWSDVLNNPKQGALFCSDKAMLIKMNLPLDYDDNDELKKTHADILPNSEPENECDLVLSKLDQPVKAIIMSVLGDIGNKKHKRVPASDQSGNDGKLMSWSELVQGTEQKTIRH